MKPYFFANPKNRDICTPVNAESMNHAYLLTGGNEGNRKVNLSDAIKFIQIDAGVILRQSALYETVAWGVNRQQDFLNQALLVETGLGAPDLLNVLLGIEKKMGRIRLEKYGPRLIDIDIIFFNNDIIKTDGLTIPHPHLQDRRFVLEPMNEIAPGYVHPVFHKTVESLLAECPDRSGVKKLWNEI
jgi:2-amino-4-hydroxy-6-hydroxymethyldihydropteridine diphosphokinase